MTVSKSKERGGTGFKAAWRHLANAKPGTRFQSDYEARHKEGRPGRLKRLLEASVGIALIFVGVVLLAVPGPGLLVVAVGAGFLARQSPALARALDRAEVWLRRMLAPVARAWNRAPKAAKVVIGAVAVAAAGGVAVLGVLYVMR